MLLLLYYKIILLCYKKAKKSNQNNVDKHKHCSIGQRTFSDHTAANQHQIDSKLDDMCNLKNTLLI